MVGFEPTIYCTKNRCPTARPHPKTFPLDSLSLIGTQDPFWKNFICLEISECHVALIEYVNQHSAVTSTAFNQFMSVRRHIYRENL